MFISIVSPPKYGFTRWPFTLNVSPSLSSSSTVPNCETALTVNGPDHLDFNFPGNKRRRELNKSTCIQEQLAFGEVNSREISLCVLHK